MIIKSKNILPGKDHGFTLVEVMIVVVIIALLAAVSIPLLRRARLQADETAAITAVKQLITAEEMWRANNPDYAYFTGFMTSAYPYYIKGFTALGAGWYRYQRYGFIIYNATTQSALGYVTTPQNYSIIADPNRVSPYPGARRFCASGDGIIKVYDNTQPLPNCTGNAIGE